MTAFVAGATGYTGRAVVAELRRRGLDVVAHIRADSTRASTLVPEFESLGAAVDRTAWEPEALAATMSRLRPDVVFGLLGITRAGARAEERRTGVEPSYETVDYGMTAMLADAAVAAGIAPRFVYLSSLGVGPSATGEYLRWRWKTEEHLRASGLPLTIARPSFITGEGRDENRPLERVGAVVVGGALSLVGALGAKRLQRRYRARTNDELARALVDAALDPACVGRTLEGEDLG